MRVGQAQQFLIDEFMAAHDQVKFMFTLLTQLIFFVLIIILVMIYVFVWVPYTTDLKFKIWRTNGMLNMIPISIVTKNERLCNKMVNDHIFESVL